MVTLRDVETYISKFRIRELMLCMDLLGLRKNGKKAEMHARLLDYCKHHANGGGTGSNPGTVVEKVYQEMYQQLGTMTGGINPHKEEDLAPGAFVQHHQSSARRSRAMSFMEAGCSGRQPLAPRGCVLGCLCGQAMWREGRMIQCKDVWCQTWLHKDCTNYDDSGGPKDFYCHLCRCRRADPFWEDVGVPMLSFMRLRYTGRQMASGNSLQQVQVQERAFQLRPQDLSRVLRKEWRLQVVCMKLSDEVPFRYHWPKNCSLRVNNTQYRVYGRSPTNKLGPNQRDEPAIIDTIVRREGTNTIYIECVDTRAFAVSVQLVKHCSMSQVKSSIKKEESLQTAAMRIIRQVQPVGLGMEDDGVETVSAVISLKCPLSGMRIKTPSRFANVDMLEAVFDLDSFLQSAEKTRKWSCPHSLKPSCLQNLMEDIYIERMLQCLTEVKDVTEVEINPMGDWRPNGTQCTWQSIHDTTPVSGVISRPSIGTDLDEESEDEEEEMRQAAVAMRKQNFEAKQEALRNVDIIDLLSEDSDEDMDLGKHKDQIPCSSHDAVWSTNPNSSHQTSWPHGLLLQSNKPKLPQYEVQGLSQPPAHPSFLPKFSSASESPLGFAPMAHSIINMSQPQHQIPSNIGLNGMTFGRHNISQDLQFHGSSPLPIPMTVPTQGVLGMGQSNTFRNPANPAGLIPVSGMISRQRVMQTQPVSPPGCYPGYGFVGQSQSPVSGLCTVPSQSHIMQSGASLGIKEVTLRASDILRKDMSILPQHQGNDVEIIELDMDD